MSSRSNKSDSPDAHSAEIVNFKKPRTLTEGGLSGRSVGRNRPAALLSIRQHLRYKACVAVDAGPMDESLECEQSTRRIMASVRSMLNKEFGSLRVHRHRQLLIVRHHCVEGLIAGLLRVQFLGNQMDMPKCADSDEQQVRSQVTLSWGVGDTLFEAETSRLKQTKPEPETTT